MSQLKTNLKEIPGVGKAVERDLLKLGINKIDNLIGKNPDKLYKKLEKIEGRHIDKCMLYVLRCAIAYAHSENRLTFKMNCWYFKDFS
jgi:hypothetical protein